MQTRRGDLCVRVAGLSTSLLPFIIDIIAMKVDSGECKVYREVNVDGGAFLVKVDGPADESVSVDVVKVYAEAESKDGGCNIDSLVVCDCFLDDGNVDVELISAGGISECEGCVGG
jgi:hypothetical protein